jgi:cell division protein ZapE
MLTQLRKRQQQGLIKADPAQELAAVRLDALSKQLQRNQKRGFFSSLFGAKNETPRGVYLHGAVGGGKTMLMDLFFETVPILQKRRVHFHAFMQDMHQRRARSDAEDVIATLADAIASEVRLLCLDEMQIVDIADAMIIGRLYEALLARGVTLVTTANVPPDGLYRDGLNRELFLPFIAKLNDTMDIVALQSAADYRLGRIQARDTFLFPATAENRIAFNALWNDLTDHAAGKPQKLAVLGRELLVPKAAHGCAAFTFSELCGQALGPADYLAITQAFQTVFVSGLKPLDESQRNEAKRFIIMIDAFYDAGTRLVALSDVSADGLQPEGSNAFAFQRTVSRLKEMQAATWWAVT